MDLDESISLDGDRASTVFRFVQEALTNCVMHACAKAIGVRGARDHASIVFSVEDDGKGFDVGRTHGIGLVGMTERAALAGGKLHVKSAPGKGTKLSLRLPGTEGIRRSS